MAPLGLRGIGSAGYQQEIVSPVSGSRNLQLVSDRGMGVAYCPVWRIPTREILSGRVVAATRTHTCARHRAHASCQQPSQRSFSSSRSFFPLPVSLPPRRQSLSVFHVVLGAAMVRDHREISRRNRNRRGIGRTETQLGDNRFSSQSSHGVVASVVYEGK